LQSRPGALKPSESSGRSNPPIGHVRPFENHRPGRRWNRSECNVAAAEESITPTPRRPALGADHNKIISEPVSSRPTWTATDGRISPTVPGRPPIGSVRRRFLNCCHCA
jgi:hypothetical protein